MTKLLKKLLKNSKNIKQCSVFPNSGNGGNTAKIICVLKIEKNVWNFYFLKTLPSLREQSKTHFFKNIVSTNGYVPV